MTWGNIWCGNRDSRKILSTRFEWKSNISIVTNHWFWMKEFIFFTLNDRMNTIGEAIDDATWDD